MARWPAHDETSSSKDSSYDQLQSTPSRGHPNAATAAAHWLHVINRQGGFEKCGLKVRQSSCRSYSMHAPLTQNSPTPQVIPQPPQLASFVAVSVQVPEQSVNPKDAQVPPPPPEEPKLLWPSDTVHKPGEISKRSSETLSHAEFPTAFVGHSNTRPRSFSIATL